MFPSLLELDPLLSPRESGQHMIAHHTACKHFFYVFTTTCYREYQLQAWPWT